MAKHLDLARMTVASGGAGPLTLGLAVPSFITFGAAGAVSGDQIVYAIEDGLQREIGNGTYTVTNGVVTFIRDTILASTQSGLPIDCSSNAQIFSTIAAEDIVVSHAALSPRVVQYATNAHNRVYTAEGTVTLAQDPTPGNILVVFAAGRQPATLPSPFTELGNQGTNFNSIRVGYKVVEEGASKSVTVGNFGDWINVAILEVTNWESYVFEVGLPSGEPLAAGDDLIATKASLTLAMIEFDNTLTLSDYNSDYTVLAYYGSYDGGNHNGAVMVSNPYTASITAPSLTLSGTAVYPCYATVTLRGRTVNNVLAGLNDVNMATPPSDGALLGFDNALGAWRPYSIDELKTALGISSGGGGGGTRYAKIVVSIGPTNGTEMYIASLDGATLYSGAMAAHGVTTVATTYSGGGTASPTGTLIGTCDDGFTPQYVALSSLIVSGNWSGGYIYGFADVYTSVDEGEHWTYLGRAQLAGANNPGAITGAGA